MKKRTALLAVIAMLATTMMTVGPVAAQTTTDVSPRDGTERLAGSVSGDFQLRSPDDIVQVFIQLDEPAVAEVAADGGQTAAQRAQARLVRAQQDAVRSALSDVIVEERSNLVVAANGLRAMVRVGDIPAIRATDGVKNVAAVAKYRPTLETSVPHIGRDAVRNAGFTGEGISIAIIDTGVDYTHAAFGGPGTTEAYEANDPGTIGDGGFPTAKVVDGYDFAGPTYDASTPGLDTPSPDADPLDVNGHGTHVASTAAGLDVTGDLEEGVAEDALIYAFKVFGDVAGSTDLVSDAIERALDPNNDDAIDDAVDIINMSLGSPFGHPDDPSAIAAQNAVENGVVVVASAGNEGTPPYVTGSPAVADGVISVAASIDAGVTVLAMTVNSGPGGIAGTYEAQAGDFGSLDPATTADLEVAEPLDACGGITNDLAGQIALIQRGTCSFSEKIRNAQSAGAVGALVFNNVEGPPIGMAQDGTADQPTIPAMMVGLLDGEAILAATDAGTVNVTLSDAVTIPKPELEDNMADFTSRGPGFGNVFKPDLSAPGFSIGAADVGSGTGLALLSGTSMAAPHIAGAAALLLESNPDLEPMQVKALLMNSATPANVEGPTFTAGAVPIARQGTGMAQIDTAVLDLDGYATPGGVVFRLNPTEETSETATIDITRLNGDATYDVALVPNQELTGVTWDVSATEVTTNGGEGSIDVTVTVDPSAMASDDGFFSQSESDGWLELTNQADAADKLVVGLVTVADPASQATATGGEQLVTVGNAGPADGFADGFTNLGGGDGSLAAVGYRTGFVSEDDGGPYATIDFGVALDAPWSSPSAVEVDIFIDVDEDGADDYALVAADLGYLTGGAPAGVLVTALVDLVNGGGLLLYYGIADLNDHVMVLPADLTGDFGFLADDDTNFNMTTVVFDQLGVAGISDTVAVDLETEITAADGLSLAVPAAAGSDVTVEGEGEMLWLFQNNPVPSQFAIAEVTTSEEPPPPPPPPPPDEEPPSFDDVPDDHLFNTEITWLAEEGITRGCNPPDNTLFCPDDPVTRGQMAAFLNRALDLDATAEDYFGDDDGNVFEGDINRLAESGITRGCNPPINDEFCPDRTLTRAEMATFMVRGFGFTDGAGDDLFTDDDTSVHESAIDILGTAGVTRGCNPPTNDLFCPDREITRGEMAAFIYRAFQASAPES
jgi:minor extracellular serine protease Vpr